MSWQSYVDDHLLCPLANNQRLSHGAIIGLDGSVWAQSANFPAVTHTEVMNIVGGFTDAGTLAQSGLFVGGAKYMMIQGDAGQVIRGKKGAGGLTIKKTNSAMIIGIYEEPVQPGDCNVVVEGLGDYLAGTGL